MSGMTGAGHGLKYALQLHGGHGVHGVGGGQHGWQHGGGQGQEYLHGPVPQGRIAGHVGQKHVEHITLFMFKILFLYLCIFYLQYIYIKFNCLI